MKKYPLGSALLAGAIALSVTGAMTAVPAQAQFGFGGIVYDPTNYASNVLQAARALQQINNQIQQIQNKVTSLINEAKNTPSLQVSTLSPPQTKYNKTSPFCTKAQ